MGSRMNSLLYVLYLDGVFVVKSMEQKMINVLHILFHPLRSLWFYENDFILRNFWEIEKTPDYKSRCFPRKNKRYYKTLKEKLLRKTTATK